MRTISGYRPAKLKRIRSLLLTVLVMAMAFLAGAVTERTAHFLQEVMAATPLVLDGIKTFLHERVIFKVKTVYEQIKWAAAITILIITKHGSYLIRGP